MPLRVVSTSARSETRPDVDRRAGSGSRPADGSRMGSGSKPDISRIGSGFQNKTFCVNGDDYTGEWLNNKKDGKGTYHWKASGNLYDGDWKNDKRDGYGTLSVPRPGGGGTYRKQYVGGWMGGRKHGFGTHFYDDVVVYEGEWSSGLRHGWGRMVYEDGSIYEGEWCDDKMCGTGMTRYADGRRYEGSYKDNKKDGLGRFYFNDKCQVYEGVWVDDLPKSGAIMDFESSVPLDKLPIPVIGLADPTAVLDEARRKVLPANDLEED